MKALEKQRLSDVRRQMNEVFAPDKRSIGVAVGRTLAASRSATQIEHTPLRGVSAEEGSRELALQMLVAVTYSTDERELYVLQSGAVRKIV